MQSDVTATPSPVLATGANQGVTRVPSGVLLVAFLALFGLLAGVVLATLQAKNREPAIAAENLRRLHEAKHEQPSPARPDDAPREPSR